MNTPKKFLFRANVVLSLLIPLCTIAQTSMVRIMCDGEAASSEVTVNGAFKGGCPIDVQVKAGTVQVNVLKTLDKDHEQVFSDEFRIGEGVVKKLEVILSAPRLTTKGKLAERERLQQEEDRQWAMAKSASDGTLVKQYLDKYPNGAYLKQARAKLDEIKSIEDDQLRREEVDSWAKLRRGRIGVTLATSDSQNGLLITFVEAGSPADQAGVKMGDVISMVDGITLRTEDEFVRVVSNITPGSKSSFKLFRNGFGSSDLIITVGSRPFEIDRIESYLSKYPTGLHAIQVRSLREEIKRKQQAVWTLIDNGADLDWEQAKKYCSSRGEGWRLPTVGEFQDIYSPNQSTPCGSFLNGDPAKCKIPSYFQLSAPFAWTSDEADGIVFPTYVFIVSFNTGEQYRHRINWSKGVRALCVRGELPGCGYVSRNAKLSPKNCSY